MEPCGTSIVPDPTNGVEEQGIRILKQIYLKNISILPHMNSTSGNKTDRPSKGYEVDTIFRHLEGSPIRL